MASSQRPIRTTCCLGSPWKQIACEEGTDRDGSAPLCWTCAHGIAPDEPHRVYLFQFAKLGVFKVGITHNRRDRRLFQHISESGDLISSAVVADRYAALAVRGVGLESDGGVATARHQPDRLPAGRFHRGMA